MNLPYEPLPARRPVVYMQSFSHPFVCVGCGLDSIGWSPSAKYCKAPACQQAKRDNSAERAKRRKGKK